MTIKAAYEGNGREWLSEAYKREGLVECGLNLNHRLPVKADGTNSFSEPYEHGFDDNTLKRLYGEGIEIEKARRNLVKLIDNEFNAERFGELISLRDRLRDSAGLSYYEDYENNPEINPEFRLCLDKRFTSLRNDVQRALEIVQDNAPKGREGDLFYLREFTEWALLLEQFRMETEVHRSMVEKGEGIYEMPKAYPW